MSTLLYSWGPVGRDTELIRSTTETLDKGAPSAELPAAPEVNQPGNDSQERGGLSPNQAASHVVPTERYAPYIGNANTDFAAQINRQVSTAGTAAQRESAGHWGHGTMQIAEGIEPIITDDRPTFKEEYFSAVKLMPQGTTTDYLTPPLNDPTSQALVASLGRKRAAQAAAAAQYSAWYADQVGPLS